MLATLDATILKLSAMEEDEAAEGTDVDLGTAEINEDEEGDAAAEGVEGDVAADDEEEAADEE